MLQFILIVVIGLSLGNAAGQELRRVDDTELIQLLTGSSNVVVLFSKLGIYVYIQKEIQLTCTVCIWTILHRLLAN